MALSGASPRASTALSGALVVLVGALISLAGDLTTLAGVLMTLAGVLMVLAGALDGPKGKRLFLPCLRSRSIFKQSVWRVRLKDVV